MNKYMAVSYQFYVKPRDAEEERLQETRTDEQPYQFITGLNMMLPPVESRIMNLSAGESFDIQIPSSELYGDYDPSLITEVPISVFNGSDGKPSPNVLFEGNVIPMSAGEGMNYLATIIKISGNEVTVDLNHPQSGTSLHLTGKVLESRTATEEETAAAIRTIEQSGCGGCGGGCNSGCGGCGGGGCNNGCGGCE